MTYHRGVGQITPAQVQPWLNVATQAATSIAQAVQQGQQPATPPADPSLYTPYAPAPTQQSWVAPVMIGGGMLLALGVGYVVLNKRMQANGRRRRRRRSRRTRRNPRPKASSAGGWRELFRFETKAEADEHLKQVKRTYALMEKRGMRVPEWKLVRTKNAREPYAFVVRHARRVKRNSRRAWRGEPGSVRVHLYAGGKRQQSFTTKLQGRTVSQVAQEAAALAKRLLTSAQYDETRDKEYMADRVVIETPFGRGAWRAVSKASLKAPARPAPKRRSTARRAPSRRAASKTPARVDLSKAKIGAAGKRWRVPSSEQKVRSSTFGVGPQGPYFVGPGGVGYVNTPAALETYQAVYGRPYKRS